VASPGERVEEAPYDWSQRLARRSAGPGDVIERLSLGDGRARIELTGSVPDRDLYPSEEFRRILSDVMREAGPALLDYGAWEGYLPLRRWLADRLAAQGAAISEEDLYIINGAQPGLDLAGKLLIDEGDRVVVESPTYYNAIGVFRLYGAELLPVPVDGEGMRADLLEETLAREKVKLVYCMPTFQNPTGLTMGRARRRAILEVARRHGVAVLEDSFASELRYGGKEEAPLRALPGGEDVLLLGTFSKMLFPGLRLGWLVAPPVLRAPIRRLRRCSDLAAGLLAQAAIHRFCESGLLEKHLLKVRRTNGRRLDALVRSMEAHFPEGVGWTRPEGGMSLWVTLPRRIDSIEVLLEARRRGVNFSPGRLFHVDGGGANTFKLSFTLEKEERIAEGVQIIGEIIGEKIAGRGARAQDAPSVII